MFLVPVEGHLRLTNLNIFIVAMILTTTVINKSRTKDKRTIDINAVRSQDEVDLGLSWSS